MNQIEQNSGGAYIPMAVKAQSEEVVFLQLDSRLSMDSLGAAMEVALEGCRRLKTYITASMKRCMEEAFETQSH